MSEERLIREELEAQKKQVKEKRKKVSDAHKRKANKVQKYVCLLYTNKNLLVIFSFFSKFKERIKSNVGR